MLPLGDSTSRVPLVSLLTDEFLKKNSKFSSLRQMLEASGFKLQSKADFDNIAPDKWNEFIAANSNYKTWQEMIDEATYQWFKQGFEAQQKAGF